MTLDRTHIENHTILIAINDLEALTIWHLFQRCRDTYRHNTCFPRIAPLAQGWGERITMTETEIAALGAHVTLVEIPDPLLKQRIEATGRTVSTIDHHIYSQGLERPLDHRSVLSSLEQIIRLLAVKPGDLDADFAERCRLVAANDRGFIPALATAMGVDPKKALTSATKLQIQTLRAEDLTLARLASAQRAPHTLLSFDPAKDPWRAECDATKTKIGLARGVLCEAFRSGKARWLDMDGLPSKTSPPCLLLALVPKTYRYVMADAALWFAHETRDHALTSPLDMLLIFHNETDDTRLTQIEFSGGSDRNGQVAQWFDPGVRRTWPEGTARLVTFAGGNGAYFGAKDPLGTESNALSALASLLLGDLLTGNRPVTAWRTSFIQALDLGDPLQRKAADNTDGPSRKAPQPAALKTKILKHLESRRARQPNAVKPVPITDQEAFYFLPHLRDLLAWQPPPSGDAWMAARDRIEEGRSLISLELATPGLTFSIEWLKTGTQRDVPVEGLRLHFAYNDVLLIEWTIGDQMSEDVSEENGDLDWKDLLKDNHPAFPARLGHVLEINAKLRFTHCAMVLGDDERSSITLKQDSTLLGTLVHGREIDRDPFTGWFKGLLMTFLGLEEADLHQGQSCPPTRPQARPLFDDRARVVASAVIYGEKPFTTKGKADVDVMLARLTTVDGHGTGHTCDPAFAMQEVRDGLYKRYLNWGTWYTATSHSFVFLGFDGYFPRDIIHRLHMDTIYRRMALLAQANVAILEAFSLAVADALRLAAPTGACPAQRDKDLTRYYRHLHRAQLEFTNHIWFQRISSQIQGIELFDLMTRRSECQREYDMVRDEIEQMQGFLAAEQAKRDQDSVYEEERRERTLAAIGLPFVLLFAVLGSEQIKEHFFLWPLLEWGTQTLFGSTSFTWVTASAAAMMVSAIVAMAVSPKLFENWPGIRSLLKDRSDVQNRWQTRAQWTLGLGALFLFYVGFSMQMSGTIMKPAQDTPPTAPSHAEPGSTGSSSDGGTDQGARSATATIDRADGSNGV